MHPNIGNRSKLPTEFIDDSNGLLTTLLLGKAGGSVRQYACIDRLAPGGKSCKFHSHTKQEEFFLILQGTVTLRVGNEVNRLTQGDFFCKPAGRGIAHQFINESSDIVEILDVGLIDHEDEIAYPDEGVIYIPGQKKALKAGTELVGWTTDPNL